jgi:hypothetical protein
MVPTYQSPTDIRKRRPSMMPVELPVRHDLAYEWHSCEAADTPKADRAVTIENGNGINSYRRGSNVTWRVSRHAWASSQPAS